MPGALSWTYRRACSLVRRLPGGSWLLAWTDPMHISARTIRQALQARAHYARGHCLDLGCGDKPYRDLLGRVERYVGFDLSENELADVHGDGMAMAFPDQSFDTVLCTEVLEHVPEPARLMAEAARVLRPGGVLLLTAPQTWGLHGEPHDFYRFTRYGLRYLAEQSGLVVVEEAQTCGLWATLAQRVVDTVIFNRATERPTWAIALLSLALAPLLMLGYGLDLVMARRGDTLDNVLVARKPLPPGDGG